eukprot:gnl/MRDRNA2_/MRDRNA2_67571_c0_seq1.p1 gnl/MRDRNA2_/MRDRNA2_67571_c0~~gnl/MRDRNA2_/MRDRNA2_67571_c0_seq1.p1  ORF type:complete len:116 (-),score=18.24 gnl/MRDRNA2_/MRDRNA2_67571_c0_seq1:147-494(-)
MGWTSEVRFHVRTPVPVTRLLRQRFTHKGFQNFNAGYRGLIGMDASGTHSRAHAQFAAFALDLVDDKQFSELKSLLGPCLDQHGVDAALTSQIASLAADIRGIGLQLFHLEGQHC